MPLPGKKKILLIYNIVPELFVVFFFHATVMCELNISPNIFNLSFLVLKIIENITTIIKCDGRLVL